MFGALQLILSQLPTIHSLRGVNVLCTLCTLGFTITCVAMSIKNGQFKQCCILYSTGLSSSMCRVTLLSQDVTSAKNSALVDDAFCSSCAGIDVAHLPGSLAGVSEVACNAQALRRIVAPWTTLWRALPRQRCSTQWRRWASLPSPLVTRCCLRWALRLHC